MVRRVVSSSAIALGILAQAAPVLAQQQPEPSGQPAPEPSGGGATGGSGGGATGGSGPATDMPEKKAPSNPTAGYAYGDHSTAARTSHHAHYRQRGPVVNLPGFEQTGDGGSRLFVQLTQSVPVEERKAQGSITYVLKGASPRVWNNTNALVTVHFNTPVSRARLVPHGQDLLFIVELRAAATPTFKMTEAADKTAMLTIDFPKGDFSQAGEAPLGEPAPATPAEKPKPAHRGGHKPAAGKKTPAPAAPKR